MSGFAVQVKDKTKSENHLELLRKEHVKLLQKYDELDKKYQMVAAERGDPLKDGFINQLVKIARRLCNNSEFSDLEIKLEKTSLKGHKFIFSARGCSWPGDLTTGTLDLSHYNQFVGSLIARWVYTDEAALGDSVEETLLILEASVELSLTELMDKCQKRLIPFVDVRNCTKLYEISEKCSAAMLKDHCSSFISVHWTDLARDDFISMSPSLLYEMFKQKSDFPLHEAVRNHREDVVFLFLVENDVQMPGILNIPDNSDNVPLFLALTTNQPAIARELVRRGADIDVVVNGKTILHRALETEDSSIVDFLLENGADVDKLLELTLESPLHLAVKSRTLPVATFDSILARTTVLNAKDSHGNTPLLVALQTRVFVDKLLAHDRVDINAGNSDGDTPLWLSVKGGDRELAEDLIKHGADTTCVDAVTGDSLLHKCCYIEDEDSCIFLLHRGSNSNIFNKAGLAVIHLAASQGMHRLMTELIAADVDVNLETLPAEPPVQSDSAHHLTPLHLAITGKQHVVTRLLLDTGKLDFSLKDSDGQTSFSVSLWMGDTPLSEQLVSHGVDLNSEHDGQTLLHQAILSQHSQAALFLIDKGADVSCAMNDGKQPFLLAIERHLPSVVDALCSKGCDLNTEDSNGDCCLWIALESGQEDIASILVRHGCDTTGWAQMASGGLQTLLHRAIDESNEFAACFLVKAGCDVNSPRRPGYHDEGGDEVRDQQSPLHIACSWGLENVVICLLEHSAEVNCVDCEGKTPLHISIINQFTALVDVIMNRNDLQLNVRDNSGCTPFACAMMSSMNKAARSILQREPRAAEFTDNKGRNYLHTAILNEDVEAVLFLLSVNVNLNSPTKDSAKLQPLHLAVTKGSDFMIRHLLLAGADVNGVTAQNQTPLHTAALNGMSDIVNVLLDQREVNVNAVDCRGDNALHVGMQNGQLAVVKVLLQESDISVVRPNNKGQAPAHTLAKFGKENAASMFTALVEAVPDIPVVNLQDRDGNTPLLLAYMAGNVSLCKVLVSAGAMLGVANAEGVTIFNHQIATKQLLFRLLAMLSSEPKWSESDFCLECTAKFSLTQRKHHCRHCGRILCKVCSEKMMPIMKFEIHKSVRVCSLCSDVLTMGV